jgi:hypothetical protein
MMTNASLRARLNPAGKFTSSEMVTMNASQRIKAVRLPDGSRSVQSPWVWRGFFFLSLIGLGVCLSLLSGGDTGYAGAWAVITLGWFAISMWLWRKNTTYDDAEWEAQKRANNPQAARVAPAVSVRRGGHVGRGGHIT